MELMYIVVWQKKLMTVREFAELDYLEKCAYRAMMEFEVDNMQKDRR